MRYIIFVVVVILLIPGTVFADVYSFLLANNATEAHRKKEGDIVVVKKGDWEWGRKELQQYLVVLVDVEEPFTEEEIKNFRTPLLEDGSLLVEHAEENAQRNGRAGHAVKRLAKNRYRIGFADIQRLLDQQSITIDWTRVRDEEDRYQPLLDRGIILPYQDLVYCKHVKRTLKKKDFKRIRNAQKQNAQRMLEE